MTIEQDAPKGDEPKGESDEDILKEARERRAQCVTFDSENIRDAKSDLLFLTGGTNQWDPLAVQTRVTERRPILTVNNLPTFLHQVTNQQRKNTPSIKVHPVDDEGDVETAEIIQGGIRHIEYESNADICYDTAVNSSAAIGFGYFRLVTEREAEDSFDQKIMFKRIRNALSVHIDPLSQEPDGSDMKFCFIDSLMQRSEFEKEYPNASASSTDLIGNVMYSGWFTLETVLVCEYYRIKSTPATLVRMVDGSVGWKDKIPVAMHHLIDEERNSSRSTVEWFKITGSDVLERTIIKCKWIPVFPVYGDEIDIEGRVTRSGIIRNAKDPFSMYNYWITSATEEVAQRPKIPYIGAVGQFESDKAKWNTAHSRSYGYIEYDPVTVDGQIAPSPQRQPMTDVPAGMITMAMHAADNKKATTGLFDSSLGAKGNATSGVQERSQQQQGDIANSHYTDNLNLSVRHAGRCVVNMWPHYYDGARTIRMLGDDNKASTAKINQPYQRTNKKSGAIEIVMHDMKVGDYDITIKVGPNYNTKREEAVDFLTSAMQMAKDPAAAAVITYLAFKNQDLAGAEEATAMLKKLLPPGIVEPEEGEEPIVQTPKGPMPISQVPALLQEMGQALQNADQQLQKVDALKVENAAKELEIKNHDSDTKAFEAATARKVAEGQMHMDSERLEIERTNAERERLNADAECQRAATEHMNAQVAALTQQQQIEIDAANAEAEGLKGDDSALEVWRETLIAQTKIRVAEIMAKSKVDTAAARPPPSKGNGNGKTA